MRRPETSWLPVALIIVAPAVPLAVGGEPRPNIYGCGIVWGNWLGLSPSQAREWDRRCMDRIVQMGGTNCPANFAWIDIEPVPGIYQWDYVDHQVDEARARGLEIFAYTGLTPDWALPPGVLAAYGSGIGYRFPPDPQYIPQFEAFFETLAARYRGRVRYYEFWNEPNGCSWINDGCANSHMAHTYTPWLIRWYQAMKRGDPDCVLAVGGLDYHAGVTHGYQYLEDIYAAGGGDYFDAVAIHPYGSPLNWQAIADTYQVLVNHGHGHKKLWLNEYGWNTSNESLKSSYLTTVLNQLKQPEYHMVFMANYLVLTDLPGTPEWGHDYGLCSHSLSTLTITPRASWHAFAALDKTWPVSIDFVADVTTGRVPLTVQFTNTSWYPGATGWLWNFGDGRTSTEISPRHTYYSHGRFTVTLTATGPGGPYTASKPDYIQAGDVPPVPGVVNPSFEDGGGSLTGWEVFSIIQGPDRPPLVNGSFGVWTPDGSHWGGKITSGMRIDFYMGQVVGTSGWLPAAQLAHWQLNALVQMAGTHQNNPTPTNVRQVWEIGWNDDGSEPTGIMNCDRYQAIATLDGTWTGNALSFKTLSRSGQLANVTGLRGLALRIRFSNVDPYWWTYNNIDAVSFTVTSAAPPPIPGDYDRDWDVDTADMLSLIGCLSGEGQQLSRPGCLDADLDGDRDADLDDLGILQRCLSGSGVPANPGCQTP